MEISCIYNRCFPVSYSQGHLSLAIRCNVIRLSTYKNHQPMIHWFNKLFPFNYFIRFVGTRIRFGRGQTMAPEKTLCMVAAKGLSLGAWRQRRPSPLICFSWCSLISSFRGPIYASKPIAVLRFPLVNCSNLHDYGLHAGGIDRRLEADQVAKFVVPELGHCLN